MIPLIYFFFALVFFTAGIFYLIIYKKIKNPFYVALYFCFSYIYIYLSLYYGRYLEEYSILYGSLSVSMSVAFPLLYLTLKKCLEINFIWQRKYYLLFLPGLLRFIFLYPYYLMNETERVKMVQTAIDTMSPQNLYNDPNIYVLSVNYAFFCSLIFIYLIKRINWGTVKTEIKKKTSAGNVVKTLIIWGVAHTIFMIYYTAGIKEQTNLLVVLRIISATSAFLYFVFLSLVPSLVQLGIFSKPGDVWNIHVFAKSRLNNVDIKLLQNKLLKLIEGDKIYLNEKLEIKDVAKQLNLNVYQTSELINSKFERHFYDFINHYRILEAKNLLLSRKKYNITNICYESGFNSYSVFHDAFKKETGKTPENWRKEHVVT
ncbi:MAG: helix-turn-helix domain-containing protein [Spirochaetia bacterium]|nr:helix-turn-helix domain-containing protein [Spirochaetia bacterium]